MGIISWFKDKFYEARYNKADALYRGCQYEDAIQILKDIQDTYPRATNTLLDVYHEQIKSGNKDAITHVADLYDTHNEFGDRCISFGGKLSNKKIAIDYASALYQRGLKAISNIFVSNAKDYVLQSNNVVLLSNLTKDNVLIRELVATLCKELNTQYEQRHLDIAIRLSECLLPYKQQDNNFLELYYTIRWTNFSSHDITSADIDNLIKLLACIRNKMSVRYISTIEWKIYDLSKTIYDKRKYDIALLLSFQVWERVAEAQTIYKDSAYEIYKSNKNVSLIKPSELLKMFGSGIGCINDIERFVDFDFRYKNKYIETVEALLAKYAQNADASNALSLMVRAWKVSFSARFLDCTISKQREQFSMQIVSGIIDNHKNLLSKKEHLDAFVSHATRLSNNEFVLCSMESLLKAKFVIEQQYTQYNINILEGKTPKCQIAILNRALLWVKNTTLYNAKSEACNNYVKKNPLGDDFIVSQCNDLIDKHPDAQILLTYIALNRAEDSKRDIDDREKNIKEAILFGKSHSKLFSIANYEKEVPRINDVATKIARLLYTKKSLERAVELLHHLRDNGLEWYDTYAEIHVSLNYNSDQEALSTLRLVATEGQQIGGRGLCNVWNKILFLIAKVYQPVSDKDKLTTYTEANGALSACASFVGKDSLVSNVTDIIDVLHLNIGKVFEKDERYKKAISEYKKITKDFKCGNIVECRIMLCELKEGKDLTKRKVERIKSLLSTGESDSLRHDLAFRLCLYFVQCGDIERAQEINLKYLGDAEIESLCKDLIIQKQESILMGLNEQIAQLSQGTLATNDATLLEQELSQELQNISALVVVSEQQEKSLRDVISTYILGRLFQEGQFVQCQKRLALKDNTYLSDLIKLRNVAIMCLGAAESGQLDDTTYKEFIALWVTAVYQQEIFIKSLDYTSWDDPYTFTLNNALGVLYDNSDLPDNVGYDNETDPNVVSIHEVQKALINRMEVALEAYPKYQQFLNEQLEAMDLLSQQELDVPCVVVAPHLLQLSKTYKQEVANSLQIEEQGHYDNWERILHIGNLYGIKTENFGKYLSTEKYMLDAKECLLNNRGNTHTAFASSRINAIREFSGLFSSLLSVVMTELSKSIAQEIGYVEIGSKYYEICKVLQDDNVSFIFSRYVLKKIVEAFNNKEISLAKCATVLYDVYKIYTGNFQLNNNLQSIVNALIRNYFIDESEEALNALDRILSDTRDFDQNVVEAFSIDNNKQEDIVFFAVMMSKENAFISIKNKVSSKSRRIQAQLNVTYEKLKEAKLNAQLNQIVDKVNNRVLSQCDALEQVYNLYKTNKNNARVCSNLAQIVEMCVRKYIMSGITGKQKVCMVLDKLKNNMSDTFKQNNKPIRDTYNGIWNNLSYENRIALQGSTTYTLNQQGLALKQGLDYLKALM